MRTDFATLVGFVRRMPDVQSFVTLVFSDHGGARVAQLDPDDAGRVASLVHIDASIGFRQISFAIDTQIGAPTLFGFETSEESLAIGTAPMLSRHLQNKLATTPGFRDAAPRTAAAIDRFLGFASGVESRKEAEYLFELTQLDGDKSYIATALSSNRFDSAAFRRQLSSGQWETELRRHLQGDHLAQLDAHDVSVFAINNLVEGSPNLSRAAADLSASLASVIKRSRVLDGQLCLGTAPVCEVCLLRLVAAHPSPAAIELLQDYADGLVAAPSQRRLARPPQFLSAAYEAVSGYFVEHGSTESYQGTFERHARLLERLEGTRTFGRAARKTIQALGLGFQISDLFASLERENAQFEQTLANVEQAASLAAAAEA